MLNKKGGILFIEGNKDGRYLFSEGRDEIFKKS
jgi:hypothetical protein